METRGTESHGPRAYQRLVERVRAEPDRAEETERRQSSATIPS
ncbi:hypothetical protein HSB1_03770 [Halogranum salarium B-1]|uniref:Uncharacterized protein n=1 Tax=Halogranum salarium B-1 TaxID=1210908 RepID=J3JHW6_9EURY|nr:hypothetical protein HSB1_03770 [Halogranum salarium B-1]